MKKTIIALFFISLICCSLYTKTIFSYLDSKFDDRGGGNIKYPLSKIFVPNAFDIRKLVIEEKSTYYEFVITLWGNIVTAPIGSRSTDFSYKGSPSQIDRFRTGPNGWIYQMFDIYLSYGNNTHKNALPGRNIAFQKGNYWDKVILITPENNHKMFDLINSETGITNILSISGDIVIPYYYNIKRKSFYVRVSKKYLPPMNKLKGVQLFIMGFDSSFDRPSTLKAIPVQSFPTNHYFGGEFSYCEGQPFIIDMLCPDNVNQYEILSNYKCSTGTQKKIFAKVPMIKIK